MNPLHVEVSGAAILFNSLYEDPEPAHLMQDLLAVELPDGKFIDVGWYPQFDPTGRYRVAVLDQDGSVIFTVFETRDVHSVVAAVEFLVEIYSEDALRPRLASSSSENFDARDARFDSDEDSIMYSLDYNSC